MTSCCGGNTCDSSVRPASPASCPECGQKGKSLSTLTVKSLVRDHARVRPEDYFFCRTPTCDAVYFSQQGLFRKADLKVRIGLKETEDPVPLCYCFEYSRADIWRDLESKGSTEILERIKAEVKAAYCACEVKNPSGDCCLGDVTRAIQEAKRLLVAKT